MLAALDRSLDDLRGIGGLPHPSEAESIWEGIWYEETHHSTAIEGNTLILKEVKQLLAEGRAVGAKELKEYLEVQGYSEAAQWVYKQAVGEDLAWEGDGTLSTAEIREIHRLTVESVWAHFPPDNLHPKEGPGAWRQHDIAPFPSGMTPRPFPEVGALMTDWARRARGIGPGKGHVVEELARLHAEFERIHPFRDGNGRAGRVILNLLLVRHGYPPAIVYKKDRTKYLTALDRADRGDSGALTELLARSVRDSIDRFLLPKLAGDHRLLPLPSLVDDDLSHNALLVAAKRGRLRAVRKSDRWYSSRTWVGEYKTSRHRRVAA